jgi:predicted metalloprotease with PDZ domain
MQSFYDRYIRGVEPLPYDSALSVAGLRLVRTANERGSSGIVLERGAAGLRLAALPTDGPAARFGLQEGDQLVAIGGSLVNRLNWQAALDRFNPGDRVKVQVERFGRTVDVNLVMGEPSDFTYRLEDLPNVSDEARRLRAAWLKGN